MSEHTVQMPWGHDTIDFEIPASLAEKTVLVRPQSVPPLADPSAAVAAAMEAPLDAAPLSQLLSAARKVLVVVSDPTRNAAYPLWLPRMLEFVGERLAAGAQLRLIMACGTHDAPSIDEVGRYLGVDDEVVFHDSRDEAALVEVGASRRGTVFTMNRHAVEADLIIATGAVGYHYFAGFTGGVKTVFPGLGGFDAIVANHSICLDLRERHFAEGVMPGNLAGNPVHEDLREVIPRLPPIFLVNTVLAEDKKPAYFVAGDVVTAHRAACDFVDARFRCRLPRLVDLVLLSAGGHPYDVSIYQAHKALKHVENALAQRARILFFARCPEGMGHPYFPRWQELDFAATVEFLRRSYAPIGHLALSLRILAKRFDLNLVSELDSEAAEAWDFTPVPPEKAGVKAAWMLARAQSPIIVTHGSSLLLSAGQ